MPGAARRPPRLCADALTETVSVQAQHVVGHGLHVGIAHLAGDVAHDVGRIIGPLAGGEGLQGGQGVLGMLAGERRVDGGADALAGGGVAGGAGRDALGHVAGAIQFAAAGDQRLVRVGLAQGRVLVGIELGYVPGVLVGEVVDLAGHLRHHAIAVADVHDLLGQVGGLLTRQVGEGAGGTDALLAVTCRTGGG
ncbi:hypothetical protein AM506_21810, partial [Rossellomorea vietnamensis]